ncbi:MAG: hypothetical protein ACYTGV_07790 [Planctomycetota bacterium]|jgi:hypothetical protein
MGCRAALCILLVLSAAVAEEQTARVTQVTIDGFYVDAGTEAGLRVGDVVSVRRDGREIAKAEVLAASTGSARMRALAGPAEEPAVGDLVSFRGRDVPPAPAAAEESPAENTAPFVPLLEAQKQRAPARARSNLSRGRVTLRQLLHLDNETDFDYATTILHSSGSVQRLGGSSWALRWNGNLSYRTGEAFEGSPLEAGRIDLFEFSLARRLEQGGLVKLGRFLPWGVRFAGYLDGAQGELTLGGWNAGGILGFRPKRIDQEPSADEPVGVVYATLASGTRGGNYYSGSFGVLGSMFKGEFDQLALLLDQSYETGGGMRIYGQAQIDFDVDASLFREGTRLTLLDLHLDVPVTESVNVWAGVDHYERLDNRAQRDTLDFIDPLLFDRGFWRYWVGARGRVSHRIRVDGEFTILDGAEGDPTSHWRVRGAYRSPFGLRGGDLSLSIYNLDTGEADGLGGVLSGFIPLGGGRWRVYPAVGFRLLDDSSLSLSVADVDLRVEYEAPKRWTLFAGMHYSFGDFLDSMLLEVGLSRRW